MGTALQVLLSVGLTVGGIWSFIWIHMTLADVRRRQRRMQADLIKIARVLGVELADPTIVCYNCGAEYDAELTGCSMCGKAKRADAQTRAPVGRAASGV